jgi:hypothetical protein
MVDRSAGAAWVARGLGVQVAASRAGPDPDAAALALSAARGQEAKAANTRGIAYPKLLLRWQTAQREAQAALTRIGAAYLAQPNVQADPRYPRVKTVVAGLPALIPTLGDELRSLLDDGINAGSDHGIAEQALAVVKTYRSSIAGAEKLGAFERFAKRYVGELAAVETLDGALGEIEQGLRASL